MLAIIFMRLLMAAVPLASASPFTFPANQGLSKGRLMVANGHLTTIPSPATTVSATATPITATQSSGEDNILLELRDGAPAPEPRDKGGFAASLAAATTATTTTATATAATALAEKQAQTTAPPADDPEADAELARAGYSQATYYSCEAFATTTHCGWHVPVVHVGAAGRVRAAGGSAAVMGAAVAAAGLLVGW